MIRNRLSDALARFVTPLLRRPPLLQVAALCTRGTGEDRKVLLVSTRRSGRWILPKGWPMTGRSLAEAAEQEAWEEAGVRGRAAREPLGRFTARKTVGRGLGMRAMVQVHEVAVESVQDDFPEAGERKREWVSPAEAASMVDEPGLKDILRRL